MEKNLSVYNEILVITNTIQKPKRIIYPGTTKKCQQVTKDKYETGQQGWNSFNPVALEQRHIKQLIINADTDITDTLTDISLVIIKDLSW